jgi:transcriptional regulator with PAS, ATPase and Fis domain
MKLINRKYKTTKKLHPSTYEILLIYKWPGNVRELENLVERLILTTEETIILPNSLPANIIGQAKTNRDDISLIEQFIFREDHNLKSVMELVEKWMIIKAQKQCKSTYEMAKYLGISQPSVIRKLKKYKNTAEAEENN